MVASGQDKSDKISLHHSQKANTLQLCPTDLLLEPNYSTKYSGLSELGLLSIHKEHRQCFRIWQGGHALQLDILLSTAAKFLAGSGCEFCLI